MDDTSPASSTHDLTGQVIGDYHVLRRLGSGGMAEVYLAEQKSLGRQVALKVLHPRLASDGNYVQRFLNEARAAASLVHPNIVQIYEVGQAAGVHFIAQEYVQGDNLAHVMRREGAFPPGLVLEVLRQVVSALCKAQELAIVHRDLKPENILLSRSGEIKVADFGLARVLNVDSKTLTQVGVTMGTPLYMSPEQIEGKSVDARSDIYSLGITCYHLLSGEPPHDGDTALAIAVQHLNSKPRPLDEVRHDLSPRLTRIVHRMMSKQPEGRQSSPHELLAELRNLSNEAVEEGWAEGSESWSLVEKIAASNTAAEATAELSKLMRAESGLAHASRSWGRIAAALLLAIVAGGAIGLLTRPSYYLAGPRTSVVPIRSSAAAQLYHAKMNDSEAAWRAVWEEFPDADSYLHQLARQGLVRHLLFVAEDYREAERILEQLQQNGGSGSAEESLQAFVYAGLCITYERMDLTREARDAHAGLTSDMKDYLKRVEGQLDTMMQASLERLGE
ncbi:MAG: serine/threonine protein kinase [Planctomycetales bacterium]|nr:serine/threonine protein kinase [Planctomycetales bacterium]